MSSTPHLPRRCRILHGDRANICACLEVELAQIPKQSVLWIGENAVAGIAAVAASKVSGVLGSETSLLIFDAYSGFHPDVFAAALGTLRGGGELVLLLPNWHEWPNVDDPDKQRLAPYPLSSSAVANRFITRLQSLMTVEWVKVESGIGEISPFVFPDAVNEFLLNTAQVQAVKGIEQAATGHAMRPLVITADRGRGKSTAIGEAIVSLLKQGKQLHLLAPKRLAVQAVYAQIKRSLLDVVVKGDSLSWQQGCVHFSLPDDFLQTSHKADLIIVDEAAAIPLAKLQQLLMRYNRLVFSTTVHGYEGTGRGFVLRFSKLLDQQMPQWKSLQLKQPVRWAIDDSLEFLLNEALLLNADLPDVEKLDAAIHYRLVSQDELLADDYLLKQVFGLLIAAHYQTRPSDLRQLLDAPCLSIYIAEQQNNVVGVLLAVKEGGFDEAIANAVWQGTRRPRGHLLPQSLSCHAGYRDAPRLIFLRVMRVAVHPNCRRQGVASALLACLKNEAEQTSVDCLGVSYALDVDVYALWQSAGFKAIRLGYKRDASSGQHSMQMVLPVSQSGEQFTNPAKMRFKQQLPWQLSSGLSDLEPELVALLMKRRLCDDMILSEQDRLDLEAVATGSRQWQEVVPLWYWLCRVLAGSESIILNDKESAVLIALILQHVDQQQLIDNFKLNGAKELTNLIRNAVAKAYT